MSAHCCSGNLSSRSLGSSLGSSLRCPGSFCGSSRPCTLGRSRDLCATSCFPQGPSLHSDFQVISLEPSSCRPSRWGPATPALGSPCWTPQAGALGGGSRCSYSLGPGFHGLRPQGQGACGFPALSSGSGSCCLTYGASRGCQSSRYQTSCGSTFC